MQTATRRVRLLASVTDVNEARLALAHGADIIDVKDPSSGALGAQPCRIVSEIVNAIAGRCPVSATIGDIAFDFDAAAPAVVAMSQTGVDYVKIGLFPGAGVPATIEQLGALSRRGAIAGSAQLVGVMLADRAPDFELIDPLAKAGFTGVMLDTADKGGGALPDVLPYAELRSFLAAVRSVRLFAGLAGALRCQHVAQLLDLEPDVLGFRGALCEGSRRSGTIDAQAMAMIRALIPHSRHMGAEARPPQQVHAT